MPERESRWSLCRSRSRPGRRGSRTDFDRLSRWLKAASPKDRSEIPNERGISDGSGAH